MVAFLARHLRGHIQHYGVSGNSRGVAGYISFATDLLFKWLNRPSQRRWLPWKRFEAVIRPLLPASCVTSTPFFGGRLKLGAGRCNTPSPVLRGAGGELTHDRDTVAPLGNQAATENTNFGLPVGKEPAYAPTTMALI